jgi:hypothetical protein
MSNNVVDTVKYDTMHNHVHANLSLIPFRLSAGNAGLAAHSKRRVLRCFVVGPPTFTSRLRLQTLGSSLHLPNAGSTRHAPPCPDLTLSPQLLSQLYNPTRSERLEAREHGANYPDSDSQDRVEPGGSVCAFFPEYATARDPESHLRSPLQARWGSAASRCKSVSPTNSRIPDCDRLPLQG